MAIGARADQGRPALNRIGDPCETRHEIATAVGPSARFPRRSRSPAHILHRPEPKAPPHRHRPPAVARATGDPVGGTARPAASSSRRCRYAGHVTVAVHFAYPIQMRMFSYEQ